jgi:hypothetical protein
MTDLDEAAVRDEWRKLNIEFTPGERRPPHPPRMPDGSPAPSRPLSPDEVEYWQRGWPDGS